MIASADPSPASWDAPTRELLDRVRASWDDRTCDPVDLPWSPANPSRGQCGVTALVLHDHLGDDGLLHVVYGPG